MLLGAKQKSETKITELRIRKVQKLLGQRQQRQMPIYSEDRACLLSHASRWGIKGGRAGQK